MTGLIQDLRYALRQLRKNPGFTAVAVITLALGIGANTAIFSVNNAVIFRALPAEDPQHLVIFSWAARHKPKIEDQDTYGDCASDCSFSVPFFRRVHKQANVFSDLAAFAGPLTVNLSGNGPASLSRGEFVSGDFFATVGLGTVLGRPITPADDSPSAPPAVVLNYRYWQRAFGADRSSLGRTVRINNVEATIVGVASDDFSSLTPGKTQDFFMPLSLSGRVRDEWWGEKDRLSDAGIWWVVMVGRLKAGSSIGHAQAEVATIFRNEMLHGGKPFFEAADAPVIQLSPAREGLNGQTNSLKPMLKLITSAVGLILLIACANVAGLIVARSAKRQREFAMRQALGARRGRLARQLLTESILLSGAGGALGVIVAAWGVNWLTKLMASGSGDPFPFTIVPDWRVLAFTVAVTLATGILAGLAPSLRSARVDLTLKLRENAPSTSSDASFHGRRFRIGDVLVIAQVALSTVVLVGAGLLVRTLHNLQSLNPGFDAQNILLFGIDPTMAGYKDLQTVQLYRDLQQRLAALPGVISVSYSEEALVSGSVSGTHLHLDGAPAKSNIHTDILPIGSDFFSTMHIPILAGRAFTAADFASADATNAATSAAEEKGHQAPAMPSRPTGLSVAQTKEVQPAPVPVIINALFARKFFPNQNPLGKHIGEAQGDEPPTGPEPGYLVVGIARDTKYRNLRHELLPTMFLPLVGNSAHFELRTAGDPNALAQTVRGIVASVDKNLPLFDVLSQSEQIRQVLHRERLMSDLYSFFALLALVLACIGLYGLLSFDVAQRTRELGIRMALGAQRRLLMRMVVRQGILLIVIGTAIGIAGAMGVTRFMSSMLYGVRDYDATTFACIVALLTAVGLIACYIPARRATQVDPMVALRYE